MPGYSTSVAGMQARILSDAVLLTLEKVRPFLSIREFSILLDHLREVLVADYGNDVPANRYGFLLEHTTLIDLLQSYQSALLQS